MDSAAKKPVRLTIFHQNYTVLASGDPADTEALGDRVDNLMLDIAKQAGPIDSTRLAVLACLHMADRLRNIERELAAYRERIDVLSERCQQLLDRALDAPEP